MHCEEVVKRSRDSMRRALDPVLLLALVCACDSGSFGSHSDRGPVKLVFSAQPTAAVADEAIGPVAVTVQDAYGNTVLSRSGPTLQARPYRAPPQCRQPRGWRSFRT